MTNKQYEHLGRAVCLEAELERMHNEMEPSMEALYKELCACGADHEAVRKWVLDRYGEDFASFNSPRKFMEAVRSLIDMDAKRGGAK